MNMYFKYLTQNRHDLTMVQVDKGYELTKSNPVASYVSFSAKPIYKWNLI